MVFVCRTVPAGVSGGQGTEGPAAIHPPAGTGDRTDGGIARDVRRLELTVRLILGQRDAHDLEVPSPSATQG